MFNTIRPNAHSLNDLQTEFAMPLAGQRRFDTADVNNQNSFCSYWSSSYYNTATAKARFFQAYSSGIQLESSTNSNGFSIRAFKNAPTS